jgi:hypothetical protein
MSTERISMGFSVQLEGASLFDLVQFECLGPERKIIKIIANARSGLLFFREGNLVHAVAGELVGEPALRSMLGWEQGQVQPWDGPWPAVETITASWQSVLLRAAHAADEHERTQDNVVSFPSRETAREDSVLMEKKPDDGPLLRSMSITASGDIVSAPADTTLAETISYVLELSDLVGESLAIDKARSIEIWTADSHGLVVRDELGVTKVAWGHKDADAAALREKLSG